MNAVVERLKPIVPDDPDIETYVWCEPEGQECGICHKVAVHGIGIEDETWALECCDKCAYGSIFQKWKRRRQYGKKNGRQKDKHR